jgi:hypothetical protein
MNSDQHRSLDKWDAEFRRALKNLPEKPAPSELLPRVMGQVRVRAAEKWHGRLRLWICAPASVLLISIAAWLSWLGGNFYEDSIIPLLDHFSRTCQTIFSALTASLMGNSFGLGAGAYHFALAGAGLLMLAMYATCVGIGSCVYRVVRR